MLAVNIIGSHDYLTAQMLALLCFTSGEALFFDDTIVSAFHTTDSIIKQYSLHNFPAGLFTGRKQSPLEEDLVALLKPRAGVKTNKNVGAMIKPSEPLL